MAPIQTCVLGVGLAGLTFHVPFVSSLPHLFTLHSVLERSPKTPGGKLTQRYSALSAKIHNKLEDVLADPEIELVVVATPNETHYVIAKAALQAGKHVLVDKPVTATLAQAEELGAIAKSKGLVLYAFQNRRWDSDFLALRRLINVPESSPHSLGTIVDFESHFDRYRNELKGTWKDEPLPGAGQTYDLGAHLIDQALVLFGKPDKVTAFIQNIRGLGNPAVDDSFTIYLHYAASATRPLAQTAILRAHILSVRSPQPRYIVRGTKGTFTKNGLDIQEDQLRATKNDPKETLNDKAYGVEPEELWGQLQVFRKDGSVGTETWPSSDAGAYAELFKNLAAAIREGKEQAVKWEESTAVVEIIELAHQSSLEGRTVEVPRK